MLMVRSDGGGCHRVGVGGRDGLAFIQLHLADCISKRHFASGYLVSLAPRPLLVFPKGVRA